MYRLFHDKVGVRKLYNRQRAISKLPGIAGLLTTLRAQFSCHVRMKVLFDEDVQTNAHIPHTKKVLRVRKHNELVSTNRASDWKDAFAPNTVKLNFKNDEWTETGKYGRIVCDLGTPASLRCGSLIERMKSVWSHTPLYVGEGRMVFVKSPCRDYLRDLYTDFAHNTMFLFHSDDSSVSFKTPEGMFYANIDISSCDSSQGPCVFDMLIEMTPEEHKETIKMLISQCRTVCSVGPYRFRPVVPVEYSGSVLTTMLNNIANMCIGYQLLVNVDCSSLKRVEESLVATLAGCGWKCTLQRCTFLEEVQFLKTSPCYLVDGRIDAILNLGVILRAIGQRVGDLPGKRTEPIQSRAYKFNCALVCGLKHAGSHPLLDTLRRKYSIECQPEFVNATRFLSGSDIGCCDPISLCRRYDITPRDLHELCSLFQSAGFGDVIDCLAARRILQMDYGIGLASPCSSTITR